MMTGRKTLTGGELMLLAGEHAELPDPTPRPIPVPPHPTAEEYVELMRLMPAANGGFPPYCTDAELQRFRELKQDRARHDDVLAEMRRQYPRAK